jgi:hypothetical protein
MLSTTGSLKTLIRPSSEAIVEGTRLLSALGGGDKAVRKALKEMLDIQTHNEAVAKETKARITDLSKRERILSKERDELQMSIISDAKDRAKSYSHLKMLQGRLTIREKDFESNCWEYDKKLHADQKIALDMKEANEQLKAKMDGEISRLSVSITKHNMSEKEYIRKKSRLDQAMAGIKKVFERLDGNY